MSSRRLFETGARRVKWVFVPLLALFVLMEIRLLDLQIVEGETNSRVAWENRVRISLVPPRRGRILDREGRVMAEDRPVWSVAVNFNEVLSAGEIAASVAASAGVSEDEAARAVGSGWGRSFAPQVRQARKAALERLLLALAPVCGRTAPELAEAARRVERGLFEFECRERVRVAGLFLESEKMARFEARRLVAQVEADILSRLVAAVPQSEFLAATGFRWDLEFEARAARAAAYAAIAAESGADRRNVEKRTAELDRGCAQRIVRSLRYSDHVLVDGGLEYDAVAAIETSIDAFHGVTVQYRAGRHYPAGAAAAHLTGYVGYPGFALRGGKDVDLYLEMEEAGVFWLPVADFVDREQYELIEKSGEFFKDLFGKAGAEQAFDSELRGRRGARIVERDRRNRVQRDIQVNMPGHGSDLRLTIDCELQEAVVGAFGLARPALPSGEQVRGAAVVMDVETGAVLAMAGVPSYDPNDLVPPASAAAVRGYFDDPGLPMLHRAMSGAYPPGSTFKVVTGLAALEEKVVDAQTRLECGDGVFRHGMHKYRCWRRWGHGEVDLGFALEQSCNVYFYRVGREMGPALRRWADAFGFGSRTGIELSGENPGQIPPARGGAWIHLSIGQRMTATPLQVARLMAVVANGGRLVVPFVRQGGGMRPQWQAPVVSPEALEIVKSGLVRVVHGKDGTAKLDLLRKCRAAGKTGTAQTGRRKNGVEINDAWFAGYAPYDRPRLAVAVVIESVPHGVHGGDVAAPVAAGIFEAALALVARGEAADEK